MTDLPQADRFGEGRTDSPYWNESVWFSFSIPERKIHGLIQYYFRPNMGLLNGGPVMWDPTGTFQWNCLYYNWAHLQAMPKDQQKFDMRTNNGLQVKVLEPLQRYAINYDFEGFFMDLTWEAIAPIHILTTNDPGQTAAARYHLEQSGRMKGIVRRDGVDYPIDCFSMRDTSFGAREYASLASGGYFWGIAADTSFHAIAMGAGTGGEPQKVIGGFIWKDGELSSLVSGTRQITAFGEYGPKEVLFEATDKLGRTIRATGEIEKGLIFTGYTDHTVIWSLIKWDWEGIAHWGDNQEFTAQTRFRDIARGDLKLT